MISVRNVAKYFNDIKAVDNISFTLKKGVITGFLGPNGAGKTTTMRMLTGYFFPTKGKISINGLSFAKNSLKIKAKIGYLPESNPLYTDMKVKEYLYFIGSIRGLANIDQKIKRVADSCGLNGYLDRKIETLSKGFRQRVGLAQSLIHDPEILILDEPTSGLDPNQIAEIRSLIKGLGKEKTVVLSTHILSEVQALCSHVIIINQGKIITDETLKNLTKKYQTLEKAFMKLTLSQKK